jgi:hypothetical protein
MITEEKLIVTLQALLRLSINLNNKKTGDQSEVLVLPWEKFFNTAEVTRVKPIKMQMSQVLRFAIICEPAEVVIVKNTTRFIPEVQFLSSFTYYQKEVLLYGYSAGYQQALSTGTICESAEWDQIFQMTKKILKEENPKKDSFWSKIYQNIWKKLKN